MYIYMCVCVCVCVSICVYNTPFPVSFASARIALDAASAALSQQLADCAALLSQSAAPASQVDKCAVRDLVRWIDRYRETEIQIVRKIETDSQQLADCAALLSQSAVPASQVDKYGVRDLVRWIDRYRETDR